MRDRDVRCAVLAHLAELHLNDAGTRIVQEMGVWAGSARIDIAVINGELTGFELKSPRDTLDRLPQQAEIYNLVFDRVCLVAADKHLRKAAELVPKWWGTCSVREDINGKAVLQPRRAGKRNPGRDPFILAQLLWRDEALALLGRHGLAKGYRTKPAKVIHQRLADELPLQELGEGVRTALKARPEWLGKVIPNPLNVAVDPDTHPGF
ncbi:MAG TPA: sce7726 family protein [Allosphingosinicella sp.]|jgi:hypothetical protein